MIATKASRGSDFYRVTLRTIVAVVLGAAVAMSCAPSRADTRPSLGIASIATLADRTAAGYADEVRLIKSVNASWIRIVMNWNEIEPSRGSYQWGRIDAAVASARAGGLNVLALLSGPAPAWAAAVTPTPSTPPRDPADFAKFAGDAARRYATTVGTWEVWNEPNLPQSWLPPDPRAYTRLLQSTHAAVHSVNQRATVLLGGLSTSPTGIAPVDFLGEVIRNGGANSFDAVALHPYTYPYRPRADPLHRETVVPSARAVLDATGQQRKRIWITEFGQSTGPSTSSVTEAEQASAIIAGLRYFSRQRDLGPIFLFTSKDWSGSTADPELNYGLFRHDDSPKPIVAALHADW